MFGSHGRYLKVDLGAGRATVVGLEEAVLRGFLGGVGLGTWLVARETAPGVDPLGDGAAIAFAFSPLVGSPLSTSAKFAVVALSPLTGRVCDALSSSHFALAGKRTGADALVLTGTCEAPSVIYVDGTGAGEPRVTVRPAGSLWGLPAGEAERRLRAESGPDWQVAAIGPAGERQVLFATISHDGRHAGRGGLGAVLGAKRVKAVAVRGDRRAAPADPAATLALARRLSARSLGPATEKYRELGTVANLLVFNRLDALPSHNFRAGHFEGAGRLAAEELAPARRVARRSCASCTIGCEHLYRIGEPAGGGGGGGVRLEYESLFALGPLCGVDDPEAVLRAAAACDATGLDTISTGGTIAWAMACADRGWLDGRLGSSGPTLRFGDGAAVVAAIEAIARREGLGALLALGSRRAAEQLGGESPSLAMHVKGLELPGYDPRALHAMALGLAVGTRGADHNRSGAYEADLSERLDRRRGGPESARAAIETEDRAAVLDSAILCKFLRGTFDDYYAEVAELLAAVTGWPLGADELRTIARRVVTARKCLNQREGWTRAEDTLPARLLAEEPAAPGASSLSRGRLDAMIASYYEYRGWTPEGLVSPAVRAALGLDGPAFGDPWEVA